MRSPKAKRGQACATGIGCGVLIGFVVGVGWVCSGLMGHGTPEKDDPTLAIAMGQVFIEQRLKSPSTAKFSHSPKDNKARKVGDGVWEVSGWVDAQNALGATVRTDYVITVKYVGGKEKVWQVVGEPVLKRR